MLQHYLYPLALLAILAANAHAAPTTTQLLRRQNGPFNGPNQVTTHNVIKVAGGSVVEDCTITLTPIVVNGQNLVKEERRCTDQFVPTGQQLPPPPPPTGNTPPPPPPPPPTSGTTTTTSASDSVITIGTTSAPPVDTGSASAPPTTVAPPGDTGSASQSTSDTGIISLPTGTSAPASPTDTTLPPNDPQGQNGGNAGDGAPVVIGPTSIPVGDAPPASPAASPAPEAQNQSGTTANDAAPSNSAVAIPGKKLEVLPIGLGVFAGISVIALIVVGLVTYERTKYRKAFRQRRLAASGAEMGYGGMSERR